MVEMLSNTINGNVGETDNNSEWSVEERAQIVAEVDRILDDPTFKSSRRCLALFRRLVDRSLAGDHDGVKERTLGVEVFGRDPDYDTAVDPVVRMAANEIRKRLAQWYQEPVHHQQVRVRLTPGAYLLKFEFAQPDVAPEISTPKTEVDAPGPKMLPEAENATQGDGHALAESGPQPHDVAALPPTAMSRSWNKQIWATACVAVVALAVVFTLRLQHSDVFQPRVYLAWEPLLKSARPLTVLIPDQALPAITNETLQWQRSVDAIENRVAPVGPTPPNMNTLTPMVDAEASQRITRWLATHGEKPVLRGSSTLTFRDLRNGPLVLVGGYNPWSLVLLSNLRYSIRVDGVTHAMWIQDAQNISKRDWMIDGNGQPKDIDYAVISRFIDAETGNWIVSMGGLRPQGTQAASDLLVDSPFAQLLPSQIRSTGNFQIVLKTSIVNGSAGPPQVLAFHTW